MIHVRSFAIGLICVLLLGCASTPPAGGELQPADQSQSFTLNEKYSIKTGTPQQRGIYDGSVAISVLPGTYKAILRNSLGTYYVGPNPTFFEHAESWKHRRPYFFHNGGIWVPNDNSAAPELYWYAGASRLAPEGMTNPDQVVNPIASTEVNTNDVVTDIAVRQIATGPGVTGSAVGAGVATGVASALVGAFLDAYKDTPYLFSTTIQDERVRAQIAAGIADSKAKAANK